MNEDELSSEEKLALKELRENSSSPSELIHIEIENNHIIGLAISSSSYADEDAAMTYLPSSIRKMKWLQKLPILFLE